MSIAVLVVDDSLLYRRILEKALGSDPDIGEVITANSGEEALAQIERRRPDALILDVVMPGMDGLQVLKEIRRRDTLLPVVMFSSKTSASAQTTIQALTLGASDCVFKPSAADSAAVVAERLLPRVKTLAIAAAKRKPQRRAARRPPQAAPGLPADSPVQIVTIGSSTGGPAALERLLGELPANLPVPILITQHMPKTFTSYLAQQLDKGCALKVREGVDGAKIAPGEVWIAPGGRHMEIARGGVIRLNDAPPVNACRPAVDVTFRSAAATYGSGVLAAVLTGMGTDGAAGAAAIKQRGGKTIAQDEESSVVWGMPRAVVEAGAADVVLPLDDIAQAIFQSVAGIRRGKAS